MSKSFRCLMTVAVVALLSGFCLAQSTKGVIAGVVTDSTGAVVVSANVTVTGEETGETHTTATGPNGEYRIEALIPGSYRVTVEAPAFLQPR